MSKIEDWFVRRGLPHFIDSYSAQEDVFTRALPVLTIVFLASILNAANLDWPAWANVLAVLGGLVVVLAAWAGINFRHGRPLFARPERVGGLELAVFVLVPTLLPIIFGLQWGSAAVTFVSLLGLLAVIYLFTSYGVIAITRWGVRRLGRDLTSLLRVGSRALPLILLFSTFLFINAEMWQVTASLPWQLLATAIALFIVLGLLFLLVRLPREVGRFSSFGSWAEVEAAATDTPAAGLEPPPDTRPDRPLTRRQWGNVGLVVLFSQGVLVLLVSVFVGGFFVLFGLAIIEPEVTSQWTGSGVNELATFRWFGQDVVLTRQLLRAAVFLGGFSGLYFAVNSVADATYRQEFFDDIVADVRQACAVRQLYLADLTPASAG